MPHLLSASRSLSLLLAVASVASSAIAQCPTLWSGMGTGVSVGAFYAPVYALTTLPNGDIVAGGYFTVAGGLTVHNVARWNGTWSALGTGLPQGANGLGVRALTTTPNGDIIASGNFTSVLAGGGIANNIARFDGTNWMTMGAGLSGAVIALTSLPNGDVVAGGGFTFVDVNGVTVRNVARFDGTNWLAMGTGLFGGTTSYVIALTTMANGDVVAGGAFASPTVGGVTAINIARFNGSNWSAMGSGIPAGQTGVAVVALATMPNGDLIVGGCFFVAGGVAANSIARFDGTTWSPLGSGIPPGPNGVPVGSLAVLPNGDIVAGGSFTSAGGVLVSKIARFNGASWASIGGGFSGPNGASVIALTMSPYGELVAGGVFGFAGGAPATNVAVLTTACQASVTTFGPGCTGSAGLNVLAMKSLPWTGSTFRSRATGMPATSLAIGVRGLTTSSIVLSTVLANAVTGCNLLVSPDLLDVYLPNSGTVDMAFPIPNTIALANQVLYQQVVAFELDAQGNIMAVTSTNRLTLTIGTF